MSTARTFPVLLEAFFTDRLIRQRQASPHTLASYRDTFCLLLAYAQQKLRKAPSEVTLPDLDTVFLGAFLDHLEHERGNSARSRNVRLAAIHSFFRYVALHAPEHSALAQRVLAMPSKRYVRRPVAFLNSDEVAALLAAAELVGLRCENIVSARRHMCNAKEKAENSATPRFAKTRSQYCVPGLQSERAGPPILPSRR